MSFLLSSILISTFSFANPIFEEFKKLSQKKQQEIIERSYAYSGKSVVIKVKDGHISYESEANFFFSKKLIEQYVMKTITDAREMYFDVGDEEYYSAIGDFQIAYEFYFSKDRKIIGFSINLYQPGCMLDGDDNSYGGHHFDTFEEALKVGCVDHDVNWSSYLYYSYEGKLFEEISRDYFEWSGH